MLTWAIPGMGMFLEAYFIFRCATPFMLCNPSSSGSRFRSASGGMSCPLHVNYTLLDSSAQPQTADSSRSSIMW